MEQSLFYPEVNITIGSYNLQRGVEIEVYSSADSYFDWAKVRLTEQFQDKLTIDRKAATGIDLGYDGDFTSVFQGYVVSPFNEGNNQNEILLKDGMIFLEETFITNTFVNVTPQEILSFCLGKAGLSEMQISTKVYPKKAFVPIFRKNVIAVIEAIHSIWRIKEPFFFASDVFHWGVPIEQSMIYTFEYGESIISLHRTDGVWELETVSAPFIRHSHRIRINHPQITGEFDVKKVVFITSGTGFIRTQIYF